MIIELLEQKYKCNCGKGINKLEKPNLLSKLNCIIEWDSCIYPETEGYEKPTELTPGMCFLIDGQIIAVNDENTLVLIFSETGFKGLDRIYNDFFVPEFEVLFNDYETEVTWKKEEINNIPKDWETYQVPYVLYNLWKNKFVKGRFEDNSNLCLKTIIQSNNLIFPVTLYMTNWNIKYNPNEMDNEQVPYIAHELVSWFYNKYPREEIKENEIE